MTQGQRHYDQSDSRGSVDVSLTYEYTPRKRSAADDNGFPPTGRGDLMRRARMASMGAEADPEPTVSHVQLLIKLGANGDAPERELSLSREELVLMVESVRRVLPRAPRRGYPGVGIVSAADDMLGDGPPF